MIPQTYYHDLITLQAVTFILNDLCIGSVLPNLMVVSHFNCLHSFSLPSYFCHQTISFLHLHCYFQQLPILLAERGCFKIIHLFLPGAYSNVIG